MLECIHKDIGASQSRSADLNVGDDLVAARGTAVAVLEHE
jgi:hypothetical protein